MYIYIYTYRRPENSRNRCEIHRSNVFNAFPPRELRLYGYYIKRILRRRKGEGRGKRESEYPSSLGQKGQRLTQNRFTFFMSPSHLFFLSFPFPMSKSDRPPVVQFVSIFLGPLSRTGNWFSFPHIHRGFAGHLGGNRKSGARGLTSSRMRPRPLVSLPFYPVIDSAVASDSSNFFFSFLPLSLSLFLLFVEKSRKRIEV